jgi:hypothetical protein
MVESYALIGSIMYWIFCGEGDFNYFTVLTLFNYLVTPRELL